MALVLRGATLIDGNGGDPVREATVSVESGLVNEVGSAGGGDELDLGGLTLLPGLIDAHTHFGIVDLKESDRTPPAVIAAQIFANCDLALDGGFTTVRDVGGLDGGVARAVNLGLVRGPEIMPSGPVLSQKGGHGDHSSPWLDHHPHGTGVPGLVQVGIVCDGPNEVRRAARTVLMRGATQIKVCISGGVASYTDKITDTQFSVEELRAAVDEAKARDTYVTAHAHHARAILNGLEAGVECFEHGTYLDESTVARMAAANAVLVPTLAVTRLFAENAEEWGIPDDFLPRMAGIEQAMAASMKLAHDAGVVIGSGSDILGPGQNRRGLELLMKAEILGPMEAIVSATATNAKILRRPDLGTVEPGKRADLVAFDGDPLSDPEIFDDPARVVLVIKNGEIVKDLR
jgi:imidazolonepropionase-like amidohydrolase